MSSSNSALRPVLLLAAFALAFTGVAVVYSLAVPLVRAFFEPASAVWLALVALNLVFYAYWVYETIISLRGFGQETPPPSARPHTRFAIVIAAHNEERVIGPLLDSLREQTYPADLYDVYVSCDNCTDGTATATRAVGAIALERTDPLRRGKTWNVRWALEQIALERYDAVVIFDADNLIRADFLRRTNDFIVANPEAHAIQSYLDTKNPHDSWVTRVSALTYWHVNRFWQLARSRAGLSGALGGTGTVISTKLIREIGWDMQSLTEDLEFTCKVILAGHRVYWNEWAVVYDEKPLTQPASVRQRVRWLQGHYWCSWRYGGPTLRALLRTRRLQYFDLLVYLFSPHRMVVWSLVAVTFPLITLPVVSSGGARALLPWLVWILIALAQAMFQVVAGPSLARQKLTLRYVGDAAWYLWYAYSWAPLSIYALFVANRQGNWVKTEHTRDLSVADLGA